MELSEFTSLSRQLAFRGQASISSSFRPPVSAGIPDQARQSAAAPMKGGAGGADQTIDDAPLWAKHRHPELYPELYVPLSALPNLRLRVEIDWYPSADDPAFVKKKSAFALAERVFGSFFGPIDAREQYEFRQTSDKDMSIVYQPKCFEIRSVLHLGHERKKKQRTYKCPIVILLLLNLVLLGLGMIMDMAALILIMDVRMIGVPVESTMSSAGGAGAAGRRSRRETSARMSTV